MCLWLEDPNLLPGCQWENDDLPGTDWNTLFSDKAMMVSLCHECDCLGPWSITLIQSSLTIPMIDDYYLAEQHLKNCISVEIIPEDPVARGSPNIQGSLLDRGPEWCIQLWCGSVEARCSHPCRLPGRLDRPQKGYGFLGGPGDPVAMTATMPLKMTCAVTTLGSWASKMLEGLSKATNELSLNLWTCCFLCFATACLAQRVDARMCTVLHADAILYIISFYPIFCPITSQWLYHYISIISALFPSQFPINSLLVPHYSPN